MRYDVVTSGYMSIDRIVRVGNPLQVGHTSIISNSDNTKPYYGGCPINVSYLLAKLGMKPLPILRVGEDPDTQGFIRYLEEASVSLEGLKVIDNESSSNCYIVSDDHDEHVTIFYPGAMDSKYASELEDRFFEDVRMALITVGSYQDNMEFFRKCIKHGLPIIFGTKLDKEAFPKDFMKEVLLNSTIIFSNESEREEMLEILAAERVTDIFRMGKSEVIVTTLGARGSEYYVKKDDGYDHGIIEPYQVPEVVDATGAGDAYIAGFLYGYLNGEPVRESCQMGSVMASFIIERVGCTTNAPDKGKFHERLDQYKKSEK